MGRRSRKRGVSTTPDQRPQTVPPAARPRKQTWTGRFIAADDERPKPPWHPFPLIELCVLAGIVLIILGFIGASERQGRVMLLTGLVLASLAGLDTAIRDHWGGFRSHSMLLAGVPTVLVAGALFFVEVPWLVIIVGGLATFAGAFFFFRAQFRARSGGHSYRF
jgi:hypothetical protein